jgi:5'-methylthioadenosine phosphorylase
MKKPKIGIIGGSGLYDIEGLENKQWVGVKSPWGEPSDQVLTGTFDGVEVVFLPRHGRGHRYSPSGINYRANIDVLKRLGVTEIISVSACGSLKQKYAPSDFVIIDQFIDRTFDREKSFFGNGCVGHVSMANPVCGRLGEALFHAGKDEGITMHKGGTYLVMEGPQFSSQAESHLYRQWGCDIIGMTNMPEAKLAREAEMCYATIAMVTDFDCWHEEHDHVDVASVLKVMQGNSANARALLKRVIPVLGQSRPVCEKGCEHALEYAVMTAPSARDSELVFKLQAVAGRVLKTE